MGHCRLYLVIVACLTTACAPDLPRDFYIDDRFDKMEEAAILEMVTELNRTGQELVGRDLVSYQGRYRDDDGFTLDDPGDDVSVVYKLLGPDENTRYLDEAEAGGKESIIGYSLHRDTLIHGFRLPRTTFPDGSFSIDPGHLKQVFLHEMGHFVGMSHIDDPKAVMYPYANGAQRFTDTDKRLFCCLYECVTDRYKCDWSKVTHDHTELDKNSLWR
jgi:hypothetical protein